LIPVGKIHFAKWSTAAQHNNGQQQHRNGQQQKEQMMEEPHDPGDIYIPDGHELYEEVDRQILNDDVGGMSRKCSNNMTK
jgi:hypothetical protein